MKRFRITFFFTILLISSVIFADKGEGESNIGSLTSLPPDAPVLIGPSDEASNLPESVIVIWSSKIHAASYTLQVSTGEDFSTLFYSDSSTDTTLTLTGFEGDVIYYWRVRASNVAGDGIFSDAWSFTASSPLAVNGEISSTPKRYALLPVYPNPFNPMTTITYRLPEQAEISLVIYNTIGQSVRELVSGQRQAGEYIVTWDGMDNSSTPVTSGLYFCLFKTGSRMFTQKILLMR